MRHEAWWCEACAAYVDPAEITQISANEGRVQVPSCPRCKRHVRREVQETRQDVLLVLARGAIWPIRADAAPALLAAGVVTWFLVRWAGAFFLGHAVSLAIVLAQAATVIRSTAAGEDGMPAPAEIAGWDDVVATILRYAVVLAVAFAPAIAIGIGSDLDVGERDLAVMGAMIVGALYAPAAVIRAASGRGVLAALDPITPVRIALRIGGGYLLGAAAAWLTGALWLIALAIVAALARALEVVPIVPGVAVATVLVAGVLAVARVLGLIVREHRDEIGIG